MSQEWLPYLGWRLLGRCGHTSTVWSRRRWRGYLGGAGSLMSSLYSRRTSQEGR